MVTSKTGSGPTLADALGRLSRAVDRLDGVVKGLRAEGGEDPETARRLAALHGENAALRDAANMATQRLDETIDRLKGMLDG